MYKNKTATELKNNRLSSIYIYKIYSNSLFYSLAIFQTLYKCLYIYNIVIYTFTM